VRGLPHAAPAFQRRRQHQGLCTLASLSGGQHGCPHCERRCRATRPQRKLPERQASQRGRLCDFSSRQRRDIGITCCCRDRSGTLHNIRGWRRS
jgi:hypothetical protein